jgi:hypothetical protein
MVNNEAGKLIRTMIAPEPLASLSFPAPGFIYTAIPNILPVDAHY